MRKPLLILLSLFSSATILNGCASGEDGFAGTAGTSSTNIILHSNFSAAFEDFMPDVIELPAGTIGTGTPPATVPSTTIQVVYANVTTDVTAIAGDFENAKVTSGTMHFRTEWGLLDTATCQLTSEGQCSVTWQSITNLSVLDDGAGNIDLYNNVTVWTYGEEAFDDANGNGYFDDGETFTDVDEPYVDINNNGTYDVGDIIIDVDNDGLHTVADGMYNGTRCRHSTLCSSTKRIPIYVLTYIYLAYDGT